MRLTPAPFSPLFIGEGSSTCEQEEAARQAEAVFQSPLHRGRLFNRRELVRHDVLDLPFSPLFIGEGSSTRGRRLGAGHIGVLSVPSSSGKALQRRFTVAHGLKDCSFQSPLHRGRLFNSYAVHTSCGIQNFQSPLHRGRLFNKAWQDMKATFSGSFSPLFIGEGSSTSATVEHEAVQLALSVPSSSGKALQHPPPAA